MIESQLYFYRFDIKNQDDFYAWNHLNHHMAKYGIELFKLSDVSFLKYDFLENISKNLSGISESFKIAIDTDYLFSNQFNIILEYSDPIFNMIRFFDFFQQVNTDNDDIKIGYFIETENDSFIELSNLRKKSFMFDWCKDSYNEIDFDKIYNDK
jgi:hypothetical protein